MLQTPETTVRSLTLDDILFLTTNESHPVPPKMGALPAGALTSVPPAPGGSMQQQGLAPQPGARPTSVLGPRSLVAAMQSGRVSRMASRLLPPSSCCRGLLAEWETCACCSLCWGLAASSCAALASKSKHKPVACLMRVRCTDGKAPDGQALRRCHRAGLREPPYACAPEASCSATASSAAPGLACPQRSRCCSCSGCP